MSGPTMPPGPTSSGPTPPGPPPGPTPPGPMPPAAVAQAPLTPARGTPKTLIVSLWALCALALTQGVIAGLFLNTNPELRMTHLIIGSLLPYVALVAIPVIAGIAHSRRQVSPPLAIAAYALPVLLWAQAVLGHIQLPATIAIHVPFGIAMAVYPGVLATLAARPLAKTPPPPRRQPGR